MMVNIITAKQTVARRDLLIFVKFLFVKVFHTLGGQPEAMSHVRTFVARTICQFAGRLQTVR